MSDTSARDQGRDKSRDNAMSMAAMSSMSSERIEPDENVWTRRLVLFLRIMAVLSILKGLYHWAQVTGFIGGVSGDLCLERASGVVEGVGFYWRYEKMIRRLESCVHSVVGATGAISAS